MKRLDLVVAGLGAALLVGVATNAAPALPAAGSDNRPIPQGSPWHLGVYDPSGDFTADTTPTIEHLFLPWEDVDLSSLRLADQYALAHKRALLITIEPWSWDQAKRAPVATLRAGIADGTYDGNIEAICRMVGTLTSPVTIRWGQEMEDTSGRFSWADWQPAEYIAAYRRVVDTCRPLAPHARFMWSPKGDSTLAAYYPGDKYVDDIGLSVFGLQKYDNDTFGHDRTFAEILKPSYDQVLQFNKPIYVAELGYSGDQDYVDRWARTVLKNDPQFPRLVAAVYFDDKDVVAWPGYGVPDWRVKENVVP